MIPKPKLTGKSFLSSEVNTAKRLLPGHLVTHTPLTSQQTSHFYPTPAPPAVFLTLLNGNAFHAPAQARNRAIPVEFCFSLPLLMKQPTNAGT